MSKFTEARRIFCLKRRKRYAKLFKEGYSYAAAARKVGVRIDTACVWRNGKRRNGLKICQHRMTELL